MDKTDLKLNRSFFTGILIGPKKLEIGYNWRWDIIGWFYYIWLACAYPINVRTAEPWSGNFFRNPQIKTKKIGGFETSFQV